MRKPPQYRCGLCCILSIWVAFFSAGEIVVDRAHMTVEIARKDRRIEELQARVAALEGSLGRALRVAPP